MNREDKAFLRWAKTRKKGAMHYIALNTLMITFGVVLGRAIGYYFINDNVWPTGYQHQIVMPSMILAVVLSLIYLVVWHLRESSFEKEVYERSQE